MNNMPGPMAHLVSFGRSTAIKAPYVCQQMFQGSLFDYPERRGWDKDKLYRGNFEGKSLEDVRGLLQEWLYFGPLFHILDIPGMSFNPRDFVYQDENGEEWITTEKLPDYMKRWYFRPNSGWQGGRSLEQREETFRHVYTGLIEIHRYVLRYCGRDSNSGKYHPMTTFWPLTPELSLSIIVLGDSLTKAGFEATGKSFNLNWGNSSLLFDRMISSRWCPNVVSTLTTTQQVHIFYSAQTLGAPYQIRNHANCSELVCKIDQVDEKTYQTEHTTEGCLCDSLGPKIDEVIEILKAGDIPLIECHESGGFINVRVVKVTVGKRSKEYIAISHVWSDGLGNPLENSLPICQLRRLQKFANNIDNLPPSIPRAWWCDTLCVPVGKNMLEWRKVAIRRMRETYINANKVLVLDKGLLCVSSSASTLEIYLRLKLSNWMRRLWTLQEGTIGNTIAIQFLDGTRDLNCIDKSMSKEEQNLLRFIYTRYSFDSHALFGTFLRQGEKPQHLNFEAYSKLLQWRSTSKQADETVCLMSMLGIIEPLKELLDLRDSDYKGRMILFFKSLTAIPISVLYQPPPRLSTIGFRWTPTSYLSSIRGTRTEPFRSMRGVGYIGPNGSGFLFKSTGLQLLEYGDFLQLGQGFLVQPLQQNSDSVREIMVAYAGATTDPTTDWGATNVDGSSKVKRPAIIVAQELFSLPVVDGILVDIFGESKDGKILCYYIARVGIVLQTTSVTWILGDPPKPIRAKILKEEQEWLVM